MGVRCARAGVRLHAGRRSGWRTVEMTSPAGLPLPTARDREVASLLQAFFERYGYDFRDYSRAHVKRRLLQRLGREHMPSIGAMQQRMVRDPAFAGVLLQDLSINVTGMFRDPLFHRALREQVVPLLRTWSFVKVWHAGCSTGEEVYSLAILLEEAGLYDRVQIYATDFNQAALAQARDGIYPAAAMKKYSRNYHASGADGAFSDHYHARYDAAIMAASLKRNIVWAHHNLATDSVFSEAQMVLCRNVLIYFNPKLQERAHGLFHASLVNGGLLCLGSKETLRFPHHERLYETFDRQQRIYRKRYAR